jgi:hypothetical protein
VELEVEEAIQTGKAAPEKPESAIDPGPFIIPKLHISNTTIERLVTLLTAQPRGLLVIVDELSGLFTNMSRYSGGQDNEFWLEAWNGESYNSERMGRVAYVDHLLVGLLGGFQPDKLEPSFGKRHDGMYARFCFSWPSEAEYRPLENSADAVDSLVYDILTCIIDLPAEEDGVFTPRKIGLSATAMEEFEQYRKFMFEVRKGLEGREREWFSKTPIHVLRLAGTLTYIRCAAFGDQEPTEVNIVSMKAAIRLVRDYFWPHSRAVLNRISGECRNVTTRRIVRWIFANRKTELSVQDVRRTALGGSIDAKQAQAILDDLVVCGFLREVTGERLVRRVAAPLSAGWSILEPNLRRKLQKLQKPPNLLKSLMRRCDCRNLQKLQKPTVMDYTPPHRPRGAQANSAETAGTAY